jgi:hypothetical protein
MQEFVVSENVCCAKFSFKSFSFCKCTPFWANQQINEILEFNFGENIVNIKLPEKESVVHNMKNTKWKCRAIPTPHLTCSCKGGEMGRRLKNGPWSEEGRMGIFRGMGGHFRDEGRGFTDQETNPLVTKMFIKFKRGNFLSCWWYSN